MPAPSDVLIIGGGAIGLGIAWRLAQRGAAVTVIDQGPMAAEASSHAAGMLVPLAEDRWSVSPRLQQATTHLLAESGVLAEGTGPVWTGDGWCSVLPSAVSAAAVRRVLREKVAAYVGNNSDA